MPRDESCVRRRDDGCCRERIVRDALIRLTLGEALTLGVLSRARAASSASAWSR
jgi:hypothetical protein